MTVKQLIEKLSKYHDDTLVIVQAELYDTYHGVNGVKERQVILFNDVYEGANKTPNTKEYPAIVLDA